MHTNHELSLIETPIGAMIVEAKSSQTASSSLFDGAKRVRRHLVPSTRRCSVAVVYGGDRPQRRGTDSLIPWNDLHEFDWHEFGWDKSDGIVMVQAAGQPVTGADVLALFPNKTWKNAVTDESGAALFDLYSAQLPMTVFVAARGFTAHLEHDWKPIDGPLDVEVTELPDGGALIFPNGTGHVPVLRGRLNPILDNDERAYLYADNIAINGGLQQPVHFAPGENLCLSDAEGQEAIVRIAAIIGRTSLVQYRQI